MGMRCFRNRFPVPTTQKTEKPVIGVQPMNQASAPWPSYIRRCCSILGRSGNKKESPLMCRLRANFSRLAYPMQDTHIIERKVLRALFLIAFLSSVYWYCIVFCLSSADFRRRKDWKDGIPWCFFIPLPFSLPRMWRMAAWKSDSSSHKVFSPLYY